MQEELENKMVVLSTNTAKMTGRTLLKLIKMFMEHQKNNKLHSTIPQGKQTVKELAKQNQGMTNIEITDKNIKCFEKYARKYGVDFALKKDKNQTPPKYLVFFKARDQDAILSAFKDFTADLTKKNSRPSLLAKLDILKEKVTAMSVDKVVNKQKEQSRWLSQLKKLLKVILRVIPK